MTQNRELEISPGFELPSPLSKMANAAFVLSEDIKHSLNSLCGLLDEKSHLLAVGDDETLAATSLQATKDVFDLGL